MMNVLLVSDSLEIPSILTSREDRYYYQSIQVDYLFLRNEEDISRLRTILNQKRYHLLLGLLEGKFHGEYIQPTTWANAVNHYASDSIRAHCQFRSPSEIHAQVPSIVNKTTSYFNVFLEIQKAVSYSLTKEETMAPLTRLDITNEYNYSIAYIAATSKQPYYILNYTDSMDLNRLKVLLDKIE